MPETSIELRAKLNQDINTSYEFFKNESEIFKQNLQNLNDYFKKEFEENLDFRKNLVEEYVGVLEIFKQVRMGLTTREDALHALDYHNMWHKRRIVMHNIGNTGDLFMLFSAFVNPVVWWVPISVFSLSAGIILNSATTTDFPSSVRNMVDDITSPMRLAEHVIESNLGSYQDFDLVRKQESCERKLISLFFAPASNQDSTTVQELNVQGPKI